MSFIISIKWLKIGGKNSIKLTTLIEEKEKSYDLPQFLQKNVW